MRTLAVIVALSLAFASSSVSAEGQHKQRERLGNDALSHRAPQVRGFYFRPGGHSFNFEYEPLLRRNGPYGNYPQFDPRNFHEQVLSDPRFNTTSPSAF
jgi:hypothetical protein